jgi:hypothetical protein
MAAEFYLKIMCRSGGLPQIATQRGFPAYNSSTTSKQES